MESSKGCLYTSQVLNNLIKKGLPRKKAYPLLQKISQELKPGEHLKQCLQKHKEIKRYLTSRDLEKIFSGQLSLSTLLKHLEKTVKKL